MATNYPRALDSQFAVGEPTAGSARNAPSLAGNLDNLLDAVLAIQTTLGITPYGVDASGNPETPDVATLLRDIRILNAMEVGP